MINPLDFPAITPGAVITEGHARYCRENGHAAPTVDGVASPLCPRCGEMTLSSVPEGERVTMPDDAPLAVRAGLTDAMLTLFYGKPIDTPNGHKWAGYLSAADTAARSQSMAAHPSSQSKGDVIRVLSLCPRCGNNVATRVDDNGAKILAHRVSRSSADLCR